MKKKRKRYLDRNNQVRINDGLKGDDKVNKKRYCKYLNLKE